VAPKNPLGMIKGTADLAIGVVTETVKATVKDPVGTGKQVVGTAVGQAVAVVGAVGARVPGWKRADTPPAETPPEPLAERQDEPRKTEGDPVKPAAKTVKPTAQKAATRAPAKKAADLAAVADSSVETPVGTTGADPAVNPSTTESDLQQVDTPPLMDPSLTNQIKSEAETAARASAVDKADHPD